MSPENKVFVLQRADTWKWDFPWWKTEVPELIEDAILREIREEIGVNEVHNLRVIHLSSRYDSEGDTYFVTILYTGNIHETSVHISDEHLTYQRVEKSSLLSLWLSDYLVSDIKKIQNQFF